MSVAICVLLSDHVIFLSDHVIFLSDHVIGSCDQCGRAVRVWQCVQDDVQ